MLKEIQTKLKKVNSEKTYSPQEICEMGLVKNTKGEPSIFTVYRLIKSGKLKAIDLATGEVRPRYAVKGSQLIEFVETRYKITKK